MYSIKKLLFSNHYTSKITLDAGEKYKSDIISILKELKIDHRRQVNRKLQFNMKNNK